MRWLWRKFNSIPLLLRWPIKWLLLAIVVFLVCYPQPRIFLRQVQHLRQWDELPDERGPAFDEAAEGFEQFMAKNGKQYQYPAGILDAVQDYVYEEIPYSWDWEVWGVADYTPTVTEVIEQGREDCDGRAVLAAALLRSKDIDARLVAGNGHVWLETPLGPTMDPLGEASLRADEEGLDIDWKQFLQLRTFAYGVAVFPWVRELIIVLAVWILLLPGRIKWPYAALGLYLLVVGWWVIRLAGDDPLEVDAEVIYWGLGHLVFAGFILWIGGKFAKRTDRSVRAAEEPQATET